MQNNVMDKLRQRIVARADIISNRIKTERAKLEEMNKVLERKAADNDFKGEREKT